MTKFCSVCGSTVAYADSEDICMLHGTTLESPPISPAPGMDQDERNPTPEECNTINDGTPDEVDAAASSGAPVGEAVASSSADTPSRAVPPHRKNRSNREPETHTESPSFWDKVGNIFGNKSDPVLPPELTSRFKVTGPMTSQAYTEVWPVTPASSGQKAFFLRHKVAPVTSEEVYDQILQASLEVGYGLVAHGVMEVGGVHYKYELVQYQRAGESFSSWLSDPNAQPGEGRAKWLINALCREYGRWQAIGVQPLYLHPNTLAVSADGICLTDFSCMHTTPIEISFNDKFGLLAPRLAPYTAPELLDKREIGPGSVVFSIGQLGWHGMLGAPLEYSALRNASAIPFQGITDNRLARQLMGALFPDPEGRWSLDELIAGSAKLPPWSRLHADSATTSFAVNGEHYWRAEEALDAAVRQWDETCAEMDSLLQWLGTTRHAHLARAMQAERRLSHQTADWVLIRLQQAIRPHAPLLWRHYCLDDFDKTITALGQLALATGAEASAARTDVQRLIAANLRGAII